MQNILKSPKEGLQKRRKRPATKNEQFLETRSDLVAAARNIFAEHGFSGSSTEQIVASAQTTRGALYYHFKDKRDIFRAIFEDVSREIASYVSSRKVEKEPLANLLVGCEAFLTKCMEPSIMRIYLLEAPSVLGWRQWREIDYAYAASSLETSISKIVGEGDAIRLQILKSAISGMLNELAFMACEEGAHIDQAAIINEMRRMVKSVLV